MATNACPNKPIGTNDNQSLWERLRKIDVNDFVGMVQTIDLLKNCLSEDKCAKPGMTVLAEINIGKRRVIEFFIYPIIRYMDEGLSVR